MGEAWFGVFEEVLASAEGLKSPLWRRVMIMSSRRMKTCNVAVVYDRPS